MDEVNPDSITPLTDQQEVVLSVLSMISAVLSIIGSSTIVYKVAHNFRKSAPYDRLLLALSCCDILASVTYAISPFLLPQETSQRVWAYGNEATTTLLGFLTQFSFAAIFYNGLLSYYYLLTVKFGVKRKDFARKYEPYMHIGTLTFYLTTATVGAFMGFYAELEVGQGVWIVNWPEGCEATESCKSQYIGLAFGGVPLFFTFVSLLVNNVLIYRHVRKQLGSEIERDATSKSNRDQTSGSRAQSGDSLFDLTEMPPASSRMEDPALSPPKPSSSQSVGSAAFSITGIRRESRHAAHIREVATQGFLYVASFALAYTAAATLRVLEGIDYTAKDEGRIYWFLVLDAFLKPLQGFLNIFVYCRPNYVRFRANFPERGRLWAVRKACLDPDIPKLPRGASFTEGWNTGASRATRNNKLTDGVPLPKSLSRSIKGSNFSSGLAVLKEESCEDDPDEDDESSRHSDLDSDSEEEGDGDWDFWETDYQESTDVYEKNGTRSNESNDHAARIIQESSPMTNPVPIESALPQNTAKAYATESSTASEDEETGDDKDENRKRDTWGDLKLDEADILKEIRQLYEANTSITTSNNLQEPSPTKQEQQEYSQTKTKRLAMDGTIQLSPVPVYHKSVRPNKSIPKESQRANGNSSHASKHNGRG